METFGVAEPSELFRGCKYIEEFILKYKWMPTADELAVFYYNRYVEAGKCTTLPFHTQQWVRQLLSSYSQVLKEGTDMKEVASVLKKSRGRRQNALGEI